MELLVVATSAQVAPHAVPIAVPGPKMETRPPPILERMQPPNLPLIDARTLGPESHLICIASVEQWSVFSVSTPAKGHGLQFLAR